MNPQIQLVCSYAVCAGHRLHRADWSPEKNHTVFGHCANNHGHQYRLDLVLCGPIHSDTGLLINGYDVDKIVKPFLAESFDHRFLNDDVEFFKTHQPTAEWIAVWVYEELKDHFPEPVELKKVRVFETPELAAEYPIG